MKKISFIYWLLTLTACKSLYCMEVQDLKTSRHSSIETRKRTFSAESTNSSCPTGTRAEHSKPLLEPASDGSAEHTCLATQEVLLLQTLVKTLAQKTVAQESTHTKTQAALDKALDENLHLKANNELIKRLLAEELVLHPREIQLSQELIMLLAPQWVQLADYYFYGKRVPFSFETAQKFLEKAALQEVHKEAQANAFILLGDIYYNSIAEKDCNKAMELFIKGEENASDRYKALSWLRRGQYCFTRDDNEAAQDFFTKIEQSTVDNIKILAWLELAGHYQNAYEYSSSYRYEKACYFYEKVFHQNSDLSSKEEARNGLAYLHYDARKIEKYHLVKKWWERLLEKSTPPFLIGKALVFFGELYAFDKNHENYALAQENFTKALKSEHEAGRAALNLGEMFFWGKGLPCPNYEQARIYFQLACKNGCGFQYRLAHERLGELDIKRLEAGQPVADNEQFIDFIQSAQKNTVKRVYELLLKFEHQGQLTTNALIELRAVIEYYYLKHTIQESAQTPSYYKNAAQQTANVYLQTIALYYLGLIYSEGVGVEKNKKVAREYLEKVMKDGTVEKYKNLARNSLDELDEEEED